MGVTFRAFRYVQAERPWPCPLCHRYTLGTVEYAWFREGDWPHWRKCGIVCRECYQKLPWETLTAWSTSFSSRPS